MSNFETNKKRHFGVSKLGFLTLIFVSSNTIGPLKSLRYLKFMVCLCDLSTLNLLQF